MNDAKYLGMKHGDLEGKPYDNYWNPVMQPMPAHVQTALLQGPEAAELGFDVSEANRRLKGSRI